MTKQWGNGGRSIKKMTKQWGNGGKRKRPIYPEEPDNGSDRTDTGSSL